MTRGYNDPNEIFGASVSIPELKTTKRVAVAIMCHLRVFKMVFK